MTNMKFNDAPGGNGRGALLGALATAGILGKQKKSDGLSARDRAALMDREHAQTLEKMSFGHVYGEKAASNAGRRQTNADKRKQGHEIALTGKKHDNAVAMETLKHNNANDRFQQTSDLLHKTDINKIGSINLNSGSATFRTPPSGNPHPQQVGNQFSGVGDTVPLDHLG